MKKLLFAIVILSVFVMIWSCKKDFIVEDISKKTLTVNAPADHTATTLNLVTFWWEAMEGAELYHLQLVKPDFSKTLQILLDTNVAVTRFQFSLSPGNYQWRIRATNAGHRTPFQTYNLRIDTTSNLSEQLVNMLLPVNGSQTGKVLVKFSWDPVATARRYRLQINEGQVLDTLLEQQTSLSYAVPAPAGNNTAYSWNVKAINEQSESSFHASPYTFTVDLKGPSVPAPLSPLHAATMSGTDTLKWNRAADVAYDSVYVALDSLFNSYEQMRVETNRLPVAEFQMPPSPLGTYYWWKLRSFDSHGNPSSYSLRQKFKIAP